MYRRHLIKFSLFTTFLIFVTNGGFTASKGTIGLTEANTLIRTYAAHFVKKQPWDLRRAWEKQLDQVKLNKNGLYALTGIEGRIIFEYIQKSKTLNCLSMIHGFRKRVVLPWVFRAMQEAAASGVKTNGGELIFDPVSKGIFLRETFFNSPVNQKKFNKTCDRVVKTGDRWSRKHFLPALNAFYNRYKPPASATAKSGNFRGTLVLSEDRKAFQSIWDRPHTAREPAIWTLDRVKTGQKIYAFVLFSGCTSDSRGNSHIKGSFEILRPDGSPMTNVSSVTIYDGKSPPPNHLQMSEKSIDIVIDSEESLGTYRIRYKVFDRNAKQNLELILPFQLTANRR